MKNKEQYIKEVKDIIFNELGKYFITDIDNELDDDWDDYEDCAKKRSEGNITRIDNVLVVWLNGICFAWNYLYENNDDIEGICKDDIIPGFYKIYDDSRMIGRDDNCVFYGEHSRI